MTLNHSGSGLIHSFLHKFSRRQRGDGAYYNINSWKPVKTQTKRRDYSSPCAGATVSATFSARVVAASCNWPPATFDRVPFMSWKAKSNRAPASHARKIYTRQYWNSPSYRVEVGRTMNIEMTVNVPMTAAISNIISFLAAAASSGVSPVAASCRWRSMATASVGVGKIDSMNWSIFVVG